MTQTLIQTAPQFKQRLWADATCPVYAVALASRFAGLHDRLEAALRTRQLADYDCLWPGAISPVRQREAPYMMQLLPEASFTDWLLFEAQAGFGSWGVVLRAPVGRLALRAHLRQMLRARLLDGSVVALDWMDPEVLALLLPRFDAAGLLAFAGPVTDWLLPGDGQWHWARTNAGRLEQQALSLHPGA